MAIDIRVAQSDSEKREVYKLRYKVYIEEMQRDSKYLVDGEDELKDPYDENGYILYAQKDGKVLGSLRLHTNENIPLEYIKLYKIEDLMSAFPERTSITTKFVVDKDYRTTNVAYELAKSVFEYGKSKGILFNIIDTNPYLLRFYQKMGYRLYTNNVNHPEYGNVLPMMLIDDKDYLNTVGSPLRKLTTDFTSREGIEFFNQYYEEFAKEKPLFTLSHDEIWDYITNELGTNPNNELACLKDFSEEEGKYLLKCFDIITYSKDTKLSQEKDSPREFYCILNGNVRVEIFDESGSVYQYSLSKGDLFGGPCFLFNTFTRLNAYFTEDTKLLLLSDSELFKLKVTNELLRDRFMENVKEYSKTNPKLAFNLS